VNKESRIEYLRRQRLLRSEKEINKITRRASASLDDETHKHPKLDFKLFTRKTGKAVSAERSYPLSANAQLNELAQKERLRIHIGWRFFSALLTLAFSACLAAGWQSVNFQASAFEIKGLERITSEEVMASFNLDQEPIFLVNPQEITQKISQAFPEFKTVKVNTAFPNKVSISLQERKPVLAWQSTDGLFWVDEEGVIIPARGKYEGLLTIESTGLPIFSHPKLDGEPEPEMVKYQPIWEDWKMPKYSMAWFEYHRHIDVGLFNAIMQLTSQIPAERTFLFDSHRGLGWNDSQGWKIFVGLDLEKINEKMLAYSSIVSELTRQGIHPTLVSVEYLHAPYYRLD